MKIEIFTDGACSGNPGKGGYGILMRIPEKDYSKTFSQGFRKTTNNRMELLAVITALENIKTEGHEIHIFTDSQYVSEAINQNWIFSWAKKGFQKVKNPDLWKRFYPLMKKYNPKFHWIKGHSGHPENEMVDELAVNAAQSKDLQIDEYFENPDSGGLF
ncbi:MAG: ribonuclease HI [Flavobacteriaceae bacterium]|jgi:ribonuclease HI|nr:ribonuclease HI [Flavobacteriaceae bacterium]